MTDAVARAREVHEDGSAVNVCRACKHFANETRAGSGDCLKHGGRTLWFGNCDDWTPRT